ncbi:MAG TPA: phenylalanine--tRNA ligase subunit beta [Chloroflexi bacterium]|jgi:phenylalanyl-tRNA synthetase beta chain|nr:phenylalanine--tRNA ligase subunit beta [Chloroflexota bacterium]HAF18837.1 phenylalanine--tRNA ligase subunit beta [Chloroflexota bacterium]
MKISYEWIGDFVDLDGVTPKEAAEVLTRLGIEVESLTVIDLSQIIVGKVLEQKPHPKSKTKLWIHQVDLGTRTEQIIAGADNAVPGSLVPVALPGTTVPNGKVVKDLNIAGYSAKGMLCSAEELLLGDDHSGILILDSGRPGDPLTTVIPSQATMDVEVTSNRPDCMGHLGVARELAAGLDRPMKVDFMPAFTGKSEPAGRDMVKVSIDDADLCSRYIGGVITGVKVGTSPDWVQRRLRACGVRPINNIVDITNYVLLEYAQPLHAFDRAKLSGGEVHVRRARAGEKLLCLDGVERELTPEMLVIADADKPVAIAGVIGGEETAVTDATADVLLEAATFNGPNVRQTARAFGLRTEASARFEKGLPAELALAGARRAAALIAELAGGAVHREWADVYPRPQEPVRIRLKPWLVDEVLGIHVPLEDSEAILIRLGFHVRILGDGEWDVLPPVFRLDVSIPEDLVEEVGRVWGYDRVPPTLPGRRRDRWTPSIPSMGRRLDAARQVLAGAGFTETWNPALVSGRMLEQLRVGARALGVSNPLSDDMDTLRTSLLPSLVNVVALNRDRGRMGVKVYEIAAVFLARVGDKTTQQPEEPQRLGAVTDAGATAESGREAFYAMKSVLDGCVRELGAPAYSYRRASAEMFHPGRCAAVFLEARQLGYIGELHPFVVANAGLEGRLVAIEIDLDPVLATAEIRRGQPLPRFPAIERDLAVVVEEHVAAGALLATIKEAGRDILERSRPFDEYRGAQVPDGHKSVAFALTFRSPERTLTDAEVDNVMGEIKLALEKKHSARFRE